MSNKPLSPPDLKHVTIEFDPPTFPQITEPNGFLTKHPACQALWYYYLCARGTYERNILDCIALEGERDPESNFMQLIMSIAGLYGVTPEMMIHYWPNVDMQCTISNTPKLPDNDYYRFNKVPEIKTQ